MARLSPRRPIERRSPRDAIHAAKTAVTSKAGPNRIIIEMNGAAILHTPSPSGCDW